MTLRERAEHLIESECAMLCAQRRSMGFQSPDVLTPGDERIIIRNVTAQLKDSVNPRTRKKRYSMSPQFWWFLFWTLAKLVREIIKRRNQLAVGTRPTWGKCDA